MKNLKAMSDVVEFASNNKNTTSLHILSMSIELWSEELNLIYGWKI